MPNTTGMPGAVPKKKVGGLPPGAIGFDGAGNPIFPKPWERPVAGVPTPRKPPSTPTTPAPSPTLPPITINIPQPMPQPQPRPTPTPAPVPQRPPAPSPIPDPGEEDEPEPLPTPTMPKMPDWDPEDTPKGTDPDPGSGDEDALEILRRLIKGGGVNPGGIGGDLEKQLKDLLANGGKLDEKRMAQRRESARENIERGRRAMMNQASGDLADRGLLGEAGVGQGAEGGAIRRIGDSLGETFAGALRDIDISESEAADSRFMGAIQAAAGLSGQQAQTLLSSLDMTIQRDLARRGINVNTELGRKQIDIQRQQVLGDLAIRQLDQNRQWNQFLAQLGLSRDTLLAQLQQGRVNDVMDLINRFMQLGGQTLGGFR